VTVLLGVDGGNSKAVALVARADGTIIGAARRLGSADLYPAGPGPALELTRSVVADALASAGAPASDVSHAVFSMAGADWPDDFELLESELGQDGFAGSVGVVNDAIGALVGAIPDGPAVVVSIGTGAATGARGPQGRTWHSSFWQSPQGAGELARAALAAVVRAELGISPATALRGRLLAATGDTTVEDVLRRFTTRERPPADVIGKVVRELFAAAAARDARASEIVARHGTGLGEIAAAAARLVGADAEGYELAFTGGLARSGAEALIDAAVSAIASAGQRFERVAPRWPPAVGALAIALRSGQRDGSWSDVTHRLDATLPGPEVFDVLAGA
jgi:N-acetylglucosamine kinase-like BadF-type ATPase